MRPTRGVMAAVTVITRDVDKASGLPGHDVAAPSAAGALPASKVSASIAAMWARARFKIHVETFVMNIHTAGIAGPLAVDAALFRERTTEPQP